MANAQTVIKKNMTQLEPNKDLAIELENLIQQVKDCDYYSTSLIWNIGISKAKKECLLNITMQQEINVDHKYVGFFHIDKILFVVSGFLEEQLFSSMGKKELKFDNTNKFPHKVIQTSPEDYSNWIYLFKNDTLSLKKEYLLPCN